MDTRLLLVSHASTAAQRAGRFPDDDPLDARSLAEAEAHAARLRLAIADNAPAFVSPAACARETAAALGLAASVEAGLADLNYGKWQGRRLADLAAEAPQDIAAWTRDPDAAPHGGESFSQLVKRVGEWLEASSDGATDRTSTRPRDVIAVTHAPVLRAAVVYALGAPPDIFPRIEIAPLSMIELRRSPRGWTWWPASH
ncbi:histidine phosphatase family protein [Paraburkholderia phytofirmans]|uniref:Phosphoglycerate mutase n=1 Tax=Paraburkholderia phytofirmans (strain DSM 17436 / LMG 22146 / PsJN) TaxID=398527 RepID=B2T909_PARPJ|nr:histidine phosphatase family protein [Paraburkholderia phytofirmans]ACD20911.1 Phosphoglycerate mutase [Paraburkholderia phytofirmans PsJN]